MKPGLPSRHRRVIIMTFIGIIAVHPVTVTGDNNQADPPVNCGPAALHALLWAKGRSVPLLEVVAQLPFKQGGHSMRELRDAAAHFGMKLEGIVVGKDVRALDRPMLAFLKGDSLRHFLVVRPIGHTGALIQVIDSIEPPQVMDKTDLVASYQWTGVVLVEKRTNWANVSGWGFLGVSGYFGVRRLSEHRAKRKRSSTSEVEQATNPGRGGHLVA